MPNKHYPYGGSNAKVNKYCAASHLLSRFAPPFESNAKTERGTRIHDLAENILHGYEIGEGHDKFELDEAYQYTNAVFEFAKTLQGGTGCMQIEAEVTHPEYPSVIGGTFDGSAYSNYELFVWDLKTGDVVVEPLCDQTLFYAWLIYVRHLKGQRIDRIWLGVYQFGKFTWIQISFEAFLKEVEVFEESAKKFTARQVKPEVGPWCKDCRGSVTCNKFQEGLYENAKTDVKELSYNPVNVAKALELKAGVTKFYEYVGDLAETLAETGDLPGWEMRPGKRRPLVWKDGAKLQEHWYEKVAMSPTQVCKLLGKDGEDYLTVEGLAFRPPASKTLTKV